jgi:hypothetical protein
VSAEPPPPPQVSPDGKYYWDGARWVPTAPPTSGGVAQVPPSYAAPKKKGHALRNVSLGCLGLIVLLIIIGIAANGTRNTSSTSSISPSPSSVATSKPVCAADRELAGSQLPLDHKTAQRCASGSIPAITAVPFANYHSSADAVIELVCGHVSSSVFRR